MPTYAIVAATAPASTLTTAEREWCREFVAAYRVLTADGLPTSFENPTSPMDAEASELARGVYRGRQTLDWNDDDSVWILAPPRLIDQATNNPLRRTVRVALDRVNGNGETHFPYDHVGSEHRGRWLQACLDAGEIIAPQSNWSADARGVDDWQADLDSF